MAGDRPTLQFDADEAARRVLWIEPGKCVAPDELALLGLDGPPQRAAVRVGPVVHVLSVEAEPGFQAQGVAGTEPAGNQSVRGAGIEQCVPEAGGVRRVDIQLETVLTRISGARDGGMDPGHGRVLAVERPDVGHLVAHNRLTSSTA